MPHENPLKRKLGPLELWQWATVGFGIGGMVLLLGSKKSSGKEGITPAQEEQLLGGLRAGSPVGSGGETVPPSVNNTTPVTPAPGEVGPPGTPGTPGAPGASAAEVAAELQPTLSSFGTKISALQKLVGAAPKKKASGTKAAKKKKTTKAQTEAKAHAKAKKEGKKAVAKPRGNHTAQTGKPNHSKPAPVSHRFSTSTKQTQNAQARKRAEQQHQTVLRQAREKHEREKRAKEKDERERQARDRREKQAREKAKAVAARRRK